MKIQFHFFVLFSFLFLNQSIAQKYRQNITIFLDTKGNEVHRMKCKSITDMKEDYAVFVIEGDSLDKRGVINLSTKKIIVEPSELNKDIILEENHQAILLRDEKHQLINLKTGKPRLFKNSDIFEMYTKMEYRGPVLVKKDGEKSIHEILKEEHKLDKVYHLQNDLYKVIKRRLVGLMNKKGKIILPIKFKKIKDIKDNVFYAIEENGKGRFWNEKGQLLSPTYYKRASVARYFTDYITVIDEDNRSQALDNNFKNILPASFKDVALYVKGKYIVFSKDEKIGLMDFKQNIIIPLSDKLIIPLSDTDFMIEEEKPFGEAYGVFNAPTQKYILPLAYQTTSLPMENGGLDIFWPVMTKIEYADYTFYYKGRLFQDNYTGVATASEKYIAVYKFLEGAPEPDEAYAFPKVDFDYAVSYQYNIGENVRTDVAFEPIMNSNGQLAPSATKIKQLSKQDLEQLKYIFQPIERRIPQHIPRAYCYIPRDAIIFYDKNDQPVAHLEVCFQCSAVNSSSNMAFPMTIDNWKKLSKLFSDLGHTREK